MNNRSLERRARVGAAALAVLVTLVLSACSSVELPHWNPDGSPQPAAASSTSGTNGSAAPASVLAPDVLPPARDWTEYRLRAADRINRANPNLLFGGELPGVFQAIPVLRVSLTADGQVSRVDVVREPGQSPESVRIASDAIYRAAPYGVTTHLSQPAQFTETFLFNAQLQFRLRTTVEGR